jgi:hypothetical protein
VAPLAGRQEVERVRHERGVQGQPHDEPEVLRRVQRAERVALAEREPQLGAQAVAADGVQRAVAHRLRRERRRVLVGQEAEAHRVAHEAPQARGVVAERRVVKHAQPRRRQVLERTRHGAQLPARRQRDRVHREVAPREIVVERPGPHVGQRARRRVGLPACPHEVEDAAVVGHDVVRAEALVVAHDLAQRARQRRRLTLDDDVELARRAAQQHVPDGPADDPRAGGIAEHVEQPRAAGQRAQRVEGFGGRAHARHAARTTDYPPCP